MVNHKAISSEHWLVATLDVCNFATNFPKVYWLMNKSCLGVALPGTNLSLLVSSKLLLQKPKTVEVATPSRAVH